MNSKKVIWIQWLEICLWTKFLNEKVTAIIDQKKFSKIDWKSVSFVCTSLTKLKKKFEESEKATVRFKYAASLK